MIVLFPGVFGVGVRFTPGVGVVLVGVFRTVGVGLVVPGVSVGCSRIGSGVGTGVGSTVDTLASESVSRPELELSGSRAVSNVGATDGSALCEGDGLGSGVPADMLEKMNQPAPTASAERMNNAAIPPTISIALEEPFF